MNRAYIYTVPPSFLAHRSLTLAACLIVMGCARGGEPSESHHPQFMDARSPMRLSHSDAPQPVDMVSAQSQTLRASTRHTDPDTPKMMSACGGCHAFPRPQDFTVKTWEHALPYVYRVLHEYHGGDPAGVSLSDALSYYRKHSAVTLPDPPLYAEHRPQVYPTKISQGEQGRIIVDLEVDGDQIRAVDMLNGHVLTRSTDGQWRETWVGQHPVMAVTPDTGDFLAGPYFTADLGIFRAADTDAGGVFKVVGSERHSLLKGVGRVASLAQGDVTGDGILDVVVAVYGWQATGGLYVLEGTAEPREFRAKRLSKEAGYVDVDIADLNGDGTPELVALIAQHTERIEVWDRLDGEPIRRTLFDAPTPLWGHLGLTVVDFDRDGDQDILFWNGDTLDAPRVAAFQGVHVLWQEDGRFRREQLATLPGAHDVAVTDVNADGRLDFVAVANLPPRIGESLRSSEASTDAEPPFESVILGTRATDGTYTVKSLLRGQPCWSTVSVGRTDGAGPQIYLGSFGLGWNLFGHSGLHGGRGGELCSHGHIFRLEPRVGPADRQSLAPRTELHTIAALERIIRNDPKDALNRVKLGSALVAQSRYQDAQDMFQEAIEVDPKEKAAYLNLAFILDYRGRTNEAAGYLNDVLDRYPHYADAHSQLSVVLTKQGRTQDALTHIERALSIDAQQASYHVNRGAILAGFKRFQDAQKAYETALRLEPTNRLAHEALQRLSREL